MTPGELAKEIWNTEQSTADLCGDWNAISVGSKRAYTRVAQTLLDKYDITPKKVGAILVGTVLKDEKCYLSTCSKVGTHYHEISF